MSFRKQLLSGFVCCLGLTGCGGSEEVPPPVSVAPPVESTPPAPPPVVAPPAEPAPQPAMTAAAPPPGEAPMPTTEAAPPAPGSPIPGEPLAGAEAAAPPALPPREADPEFVKRLQTVAAQSGPADLQNALTQLGAAMQQFAEANEHLPTVDGKGESGSPTGLSWRVYLLPYLGYKELFEKFQLDEAWDSPHNLAHAAAMPPIFGQQAGGKTRFQLITGPGAPFAPGVGPKLTDFQDGPANTLLIVEAGADKADVWTKPGGLTLDAKHPAACLGNIGERFSAVTADGTVCQIPADVEYLAALLQPADHQVVPAEFDKLISAAAAVPAWPELEDLPAAAAPEGDFQSHFLPASATAALVVAPRRIWEHPLVQQLMKQVSQEGETAEQALRRILSNGSGSAWINPASIDEIRVVLDQKSSGGGGQYPAAAAESQPGELPSGVSAVVLRTATPLPVDVIIPHLARKAQQVSVEVVEGVPYVRLRGLPQSLAFPSDHELVIAGNDVIESIVNAAPLTAETSPLMAALSAQGHPMFMFAAAAPNGSRIEGMQAALQAAGPAALMVPQLAELNAAEFSLDLQADKLLRLALSFPQETQAQTLSQVAQGMLQQSKATANTAASSSEQSELINSLIAGTEIQAEANKLVATVNHPEQLEQAVAMFAPLLAAAREIGRPLEDLPPAQQVALGLQAYVAEHGHLPAANGPGDEDEKDPTTKPESGSSSTNDFDPPSQLPAELRGANRAEAMRKLAGRARGGDEKSSTADNKNRGLSWRVYLLPYLGEKRLYDQFILSERWDSPHNKALLNQMPAVFGDDPQGKTRMHLIVGNETLFKGGKSPALETVKDDPSQTLLLVETGADKAEFWSKPGGLPFDPKNPTRCLGKPDKQQTQFQAIMLDFTSRELPVEITAEEFRSLVQPSDGKP